MNVAVVASVASAVALNHGPALVRAPLPFRLQLEEGAPMKEHSMPPQVLFELCKVALHETGARVELSSFGAICVCARPNARVSGLSVVEELLANVVDDDDSFEPPHVRFHVRARRSSQASSIFRCADTLRLVTNTNVGRVRRSGLRERFDKDGRRVRCVHTMESSDTAVDERDEVLLSKTSSFPIFLLFATNSELLEPPRSEARCCFSRTQFFEFQECFASMLDLPIDDEDCELF